MNPYCTPLTTTETGLERLRLRTPNGAEADIYSHGAHVTRFRSARGREWLFLSERAQFSRDSAIRGGVPIIFPQFNQLGPYQRHGFARTSEWRLLGEPCEARGKVSCQFGLESSTATRALWPFEFAAKLLLTLEDERLRVTLRIENTGTDAFSFTAALHTYLAVEGFAGARLEGLEDAEYWDNDGQPLSERSDPSLEPLTFNGDAIDRVYFDVRQPLHLHDHHHALEISQTGFGDVVVWNPGEAAARQLTDLSPAEYRRMLCIEAARIDQPIELRPETTWEGSQTLKSL